MKRHLFLVTIAALALAVAYGSKSDPALEPDEVTTVHVAGELPNADSTGTVVTLWENDEAIALTDGTRDAHAYSVHASGGDVYVAGRDHDDDGTPLATLWKNGAPTVLARRASASAVFVTTTRAPRGE
jgi:hypothetical protein